MENALRLEIADRFIEALSIIAQGQLADRRLTARRAIDSLYLMLLARGEYDAIGPIADLRDAFADLENGRRPELFEPVKRIGRTVSIREHRMKAWAVAAAEELEARGLDRQASNRSVARVVETYGMPVGRRDTGRASTVIDGWRRNLTRRGRTPNRVLRMMSEARASFERCKSPDEILSLLAHVGVENVQFEPVIGKRPTRITDRHSLEGG